MKETHVTFLFYQGELICKRYSNYQTPEDIFKYRVENFFRYACATHGFQAQLKNYDRALRRCVSDIRRGLCLTKQENQVLVISYMVLWKFGKIPYEDIIILKRKRKKKFDKHLK
tara:strand:+ start:1784 stop:2125 length:342 start_codon:yes stop_codon:yes gene_type:complete